MRTEAMTTPKHAAPEGAEPKLRRSIESWRKCDPATIAAGSEAQCMYCIDDARADILALAAALTQANTEAARSKRGSKNAGQA